MAEEEVGRDPNVVPAVQAALSKVEAFVPAFKIDWKRTSRIHKPPVSCPLSETWLTPP